MSTVSNPRDLVVQLLGELLYVERRLADTVLGDLVDAVADEELRGALEAHREQTRGHVERVETAFRRLEVSPTSNRSAPFEAAVDQHDERAGSFAEPRLADCFHAAAALRTEHQELALYGALLCFAEAAGLGGALAELRSSAEEEDGARRTLEQAIERLAGAR